MSAAEGNTGKTPVPPGVQESGRVLVNNLLLMKPLLSILAVLLAVSCQAQLTGARAEADWGAVYLPAGGVTVRVPGGWQLDCPRGGDTTRVFSPQGTEVLVRVWEGSTALTAAEAAAEWELALGVVATPDVPGVAFKTDAGLEGVWQELEGAGDHPLVALVAFSVEKRRFGLAVRGLADFQAAGRKRLEAVAASLQIAGVAAVAKPPPPVGVAQASKPASPPPPAAGAGLEAHATPPAATPTAPPAPPPAAPQAQTRGAFTVQISPGFAAQAVGADGVLRVEAAVGKGNTGETPVPPEGFFLFPLRTAPDASADEAFAAWSAGLPGGFTLQGQRRERNTMVYTLTLPGPPVRRVVAYAWQQGETALVLGVAAPAERWKDAAGLAQLLGQTTGAGWRAAAPTLPETPRAWAEGGLSLHLPQNWTARGGVTSYQKAPALDLTLQGDDMTLTWRQPYAPFFRDFTPILQATGQQEGDKYREGDEEDPLVILARRTPDKFVAWLLQQPGAGLTEGRVTRVEPSPEAARLLPEAESEGAVVWVSGTHAGQGRERVYVAATAPLPLEQGAFRWQAAVLWADYPPGQARPALAALRAILAAAGPLHPESDSGKVVTAALRTAGAAAGAVALPPAGRGPWPLLGADFSPVAAGQTPQWTVAGGIAAWREAGLPELAEESWGNR